MSGLKTAAQEAIATARDRLIELSHRIHANPELAYEEHKASSWLSDFLQESGLDVQTGVCDLPTAFIARAGSGPLHVAICAEYDALPGIGHSCGHNMIATMGAGAGVGLARVADEAGLTVTVVGTPAEEGGGGKILLLDRGGFDGAHAAMMVHPAPVDLEAEPIIAVAHFEVHYRGKEAHASSFPERGINAADAITIAQTAIGLLRQHLRPTDRVHGIVVKGGEAPNIVPAHTIAKYYVRAKTLRHLEMVREKVMHCFEAGALATGCELEIVEQSKDYAEMRHDPEMAALYRRNAEALGRKFTDLGGDAYRYAGSTDMGNVSLAMPSIHPAIGVESWPAVTHQPEFAEHCVTAVADKAVIDGATAMAWTAIDMAADDALRDRLLTNGPYYAGREKQHQ